MRVVSDTSKNFEVIGMSFVHMEQLLKFAVYRKVDQNGEKVEWLRIKWLRFRVECPFEIFFKYLVDENVPFRCLDISRRNQKEDRESAVSMSQTRTVVYKRSLHQSCQAQGFRKFISFHTFHFS